MKNLKSADVRVEFLYVILTTIGLTTINGLIQFAFPDLPSTYAILFSALLALFIVVYGWRYVWHLLAKKPSHFVVILLTCAFIGVFWNFLIVAFAEHRVVYVLIDASSTLQSESAEIAARANLQAMTLPEKVELGLAAFGANLSNNPGCSDVVELIHPGPDQNGLQLLTQATGNLTKVETRGTGSLQNAVLFVIDRISDLHRRGHHQIFIITGRPDRTCPLLDREAIDQHAANRGVSVELAIVALGSMTEADVAELNDFAEGHLLSAQNDKQLTEQMERVLQSPPEQYWYSYLLRR